MTTDKQNPEFDCGSDNLFEVNGWSSELDDEGYEFSYDR